MQNKIDASLEDEFFYCYFKEDAGSEDHCSASPRFWVQNMFKKREEFEEYQRPVQELRNEDRKYFF